VKELVYAEKGFISIIVYPKRTLLGRIENNSIKIIQYSNYTLKLKQQLVLFFYYLQATNKRPCRIEYIIHLMLKHEKNNDINFSCLCRNFI